MLKAMSIMAHQDDFEFNAGGFFALLKKSLKENVELKILATTRGASGHHEMGLDETFSRRDKEARKSAELLGADYECLKCLDGEHVPRQFFVNQNTLGGLWNAIREFEPNFIFCPPVIENPLAGIHIDHYNTAWAVRMVAYQLIVPNAYPCLSKKSKKKIKSPVIVNVDDPYAGGGHYDLALDITETYKDKVEMSLCHESQIFEWLPWTSGESSPTKEEFKEKFRLRHTNINKRYGCDDSSPREFFRFTNWAQKAEKNVTDKLFGLDSIKNA